MHAKFYCITKEQPLVNTFYQELVKKKNGRFELGNINYSEENHPYIWQLIAEYMS